VNCNKILKINCAITQRSKEIVGFYQYEFAKAFSFPVYLCNFTNPFYIFLFPAHGEKGTNDYNYKKILKIMKGCE